jgi:uridine kinase
VLIVLTGPSHSGKSTVSEELALRVPGLAVVKYDKFFFDMLGAMRDGSDPGVEEFALAYELMLGVVRQLVIRRRPTVVESTFTRISQHDIDQKAAISIHEVELQHLLGLARRVAGGNRTPRPPQIRT